jgi:hypothetical protein
MNVVKMPRADWDTVIMVLTMARDAELVAYIDNIIDDIDNQIADQEY